MDCCDSKHSSHSHSGSSSSHSSNAVEGSGGFVNGNDRHLIDYILFGLAALTILVLLFNQIQLSQLSVLSTVGAVATASSSPAFSASASPAAQPAAQISNAELQDLAKQVIPTGVPPVYGSELGVSFSDPVKSLDKLAALDDQIKLEGKDKERYINIALQISCEYCCGVPSIITRTGEAACGCLHSYGMRGLGKYLIKNHGNEYTDAQVLEEMGKWKIIFFPKQILLKAIEFKKAGKQINTIDLASNKYRGFTASAAPASASQSAVSRLDALPNQVGSC